MRSRAVQMDGMKKWFAVRDGLSLEVYYALEDLSDDLALVFLPQKDTISGTLNDHR